VGGIFCSQTLRLWRCSGQPCNNQQSYGQMEVTVGFSRSESGRMFYGRDLYYLLLFQLSCPWRSQPPNLERKFLVTRPHSSRKLALCPPVLGRWLHSIHARPLALCSFSKCPASSCLEGKSELAEYFWLRRLLC